MVDPDGNWTKASQAQSDEEKLKVTSTISNVDVRVFGDTAVVTYDNLIKGTYNGRDVSGPGVETDVWVHSGNEWKLVTAQVTRKSQ
jgi:ketosteroid isomerase-like protein